MKKTSRHGIRKAGTTIMSVPIDAETKAELRRLADADERGLAQFIRMELRKILTARNASHSDSPAAPELDRAKALFAQTQKKVADVAATPRPEKARNK
jgi:L-aminopeptidase/D-esterase-like protein